MKKNKTAREMFEDLGYDKCKKEKNIVVYTKVSYLDYIYKVGFVNTKQKYMIFNNSPYEANLADVELHKAITKQMEELGWL